MNGFFGFVLWGFFESLGIFLLDLTVFAFLVFFLQC